MDSPTFCPLPFTSLAISTTGDVKICCDNSALPTDGENRPLNFRSSTLAPAQAINNELHKEIRRSMQKGERHPSCQRCWATEASGGTSVRNGWNHHFRKKGSHFLENTDAEGSLKKIEYHHLEISLGNHCNLKCRMCAPYCSSLWTQEAESHQWMEAGLLRTLKNQIWYKTTHFREFIEKVSEHTEVINFIGGEPLINREHLEFLKFCVEKKFAPRIQLHYNSNLTHLPPDITEIWPHFKQVTLKMSCDGVGDLYEYIRYPASWERFKENFAKVKDLGRNGNMLLLVQSTLQILNATRAVELSDWVYENTAGSPVRRLVYLNYVQDPAWLDPIYLPRALKELAFQRMRKFLNLTTVEHWDDPRLHSVLKGSFQRMMQEVDEEKRKSTWNLFLQRNAQMDAYRAQRLADVLPEFAAYT